MLFDLCTSYCEISFLNDYYILHYIDFCSRFKMNPFFRVSLLWHHNGRDGVSNHQPHDCLLNRLFRSRSKKTSKLRVTGPCAENSPGTGEFPAQMTSNAENVSIWWRHHQNIHDVNSVVSSKPLISRSKKKQSNHYRLINTKIIIHIVPRSD